MKGDGCVGTETQQKATNTDHGKVYGKEGDELTSNADQPGYVFSFFSAVVVAHVGHNDIAKERAQIAQRLKKRGNPLFGADHDDTIIQSDGSG